MYSLFLPFYLIRAHGVVGYHARLASKCLREVLGSIPNVSILFVLCHAERHRLFGPVDNPKQIRQGAAFEQVRLL